MRLKYDVEASRFSFAPADFPMFELMLTVVVELESTRKNMALTVHRIPSSRPSLAERFLPLLLFCHCLFVSFVQSHQNGCQQLA